MATALYDADQASTSLGDVQRQQAAVRQLLKELTSDKVQQVVMIKTSKQYLSRLERKLRQKAGQHDKFLK